MSTSRSPIRVLVIPGLRDSGHGHWQSWLQTQYKSTLRVQQRDWHLPDLDAWSARIGETLASADPSTQWVAVAHSFGCLALAHYLHRQRALHSGASCASGTRADSQQGGIRTALLVAPADPVKFDLVDQLPAQGLGVPGTLVGSENDPWMPLARARQWAWHWGCGFLNLGEVGHINTESGFGPWPLARHKVDQMIRHLQGQRRLERAHPLEFSYGI